MAKKIIKMKPRRLRKSDIDIRDVFTNKIIQSGKVVDSYWGPIDIKYAIQSNATGQIYSTKLKSLGKDYFNGEPIDENNAHIFIIDIINSKYKYGYTLNMNNLVSIIGVSINPKDGYNSNCNYTISEEIAEKMGLKESVFDGVWYKPGSFSPSRMPGKFKEFGFPEINKASKKELLKYGMISPTYLISEGKKYSLGIELETSSGLVPNYAYKDLNIKSVYDGSIRDDQGNKRVGGEYVTGVLRGDNGLRHLYKITNELSKRCTLNKTCSVHVHVGGLEFNKEEIVMLWKINQMLEAELFTMMPKSRLTREHCKPMIQIKFNFNTKKASYKVLIDKYYEQIFKIVSLGKSPSKTINKKFNHPAGHSCGYDTSTPRYWWINFVPAMFNLKGEDNYTIEYRMHSASLNFTKIKNWILICMGITYVAENYKKFLMDNDSITLEQVMKLAYPTKWKYLSSYINERKEAFNGHSSTLLNERYEYIINRPKGKVNKTLKDTIWD